MGRRALRWLLFGAAAGVVLWVLFQGFLFWACIKPPEYAGTSSNLRGRPLEIRGQRVYFGGSWVSKERGIWEYHLVGSAYDMGYTHGRLAAPRLMENEDYLFGELHRYVPSRLALFAIRAGVLLRYRHLADSLSRDHQHELAGLAEGQPDFHHDFLPVYQRAVFYHALHDITQTLENSPLLGCTGFAAAGTATVDGHTIVGRNFDFEGPPQFDHDKAVLFFKPEGKLAFASVAWGGMLGVVTGLNSEGIYASVNALRSDDKNPNERSGVPVELLLREVLEQSHNLEEAIALLRSRPILVPDLYLIVDGKRGELAVIERSPTRLVVRRRTDTITVANHALSPEFAADRENQRLREQLTSGSRQARVDELVGRLQGKIDPLVALSILRDKRGLGDKELGLGNRNALDALIATHSVVVDATRLALWVARGPHALGSYAAFDVRRELAATSDAPPPSAAASPDQPQDLPQDLPEDPTLHSPDYQHYLDAQRALHNSEAAAQRGDLDLGVEEAEWAVALSPRSAEARKQLADLLRKRNQGSDRTRAEAHDRTFLTLSPPYRRDSEAVTQRLAAPPPPAARR